MTTFTMLDTPTIRLRARQAAAHAVGGDMAVAKLRPSIPHPRSDLAPVLKATLALAALAFGIALGGGWAALASGYQGGLFG